jgi:hypothetical protein
MGTKGLSMGEAEMAMATKHTCASDIYDVAVHNTILSTHAGQNHERT